MEDKEGRIQDFSRNLKLLSSRYRSVASLCRKLGINRQQFNKYLSGSSRPSLHTLGKVCDFFGVDEAEILLPHDEFTRTVFSRGQESHVPEKVRSLFHESRHSMAESQRSLKPYVGYYNLYFRSPSWHGALIKSLMVISQDHEATYAKTVERLVRIQKPQLGCFVHKFCSLVLFEGNRIFMIDRQLGGAGTMAMVILYPSTRSHIGFLQGLHLSVTSASGQRPFATRIILEHIGKRPDLRGALRSCGVYPFGSELIDPEIWRDTSNEVPDFDGALTARMT